MQIFCKKNSNGNDKASRKQNNVLNQSQVENGKGKGGAAITTHSE